MTLQRFFYVILAAGFFVLLPVKDAQPIPSELRWEFAGWSGGGAYPAVVPDPNTAGKVYLLSDVAGVWTSLARGDEWVFSTKGLANVAASVLAVCSSNSDTLYLGTQDGIHRSANGGVTWTYLTSTAGTMQFKRPDNYKSIFVDRLDSNQVYAGTKTGEVFYSTNGGTSWSRLGTPTYPFGQQTTISALYLTRDGNFIFAGSPLGLRRYDKSKALWETINVGGNAVTDISSYNFNETIYITYGKKIAWTTDKGATWQYSTDIPRSVGTVYRLSISSDTSGNTKFLAAWRDGWNGGVYLSANNGSTWTDIERNLHHDVGNDPTRVWAQGFGWPLSVAFDPNNPGIFYFSDFWGVWRSDDNGQSWYEKIKGAGNTVGSDIVLSSDNGILVGTMDDGLMKSLDGGATYQNLVPSASLNGNNVNGHVWRVLSIGNRIVATNSPWNLNRNQILLSNDSGTTFSITSSGLPQSYPVVNTLWGQGYARGLAVDPTNPNRLYLGIDGDDGGGFFYSDNGGSSWIRPSGQPSSSRIYNGLAVDPLAPNRIYWGAAGSTGGVYKSENYGQSWTRVFSTATWVFDVAVGVDGAVYAGSDYGGPALHVSRNNGSTWQLLKKFDGAAGSGPCEAITIDPSSPMRIAVSTVKWSGRVPGKIYLTEDGGSTWVDITADLPDGSGAAAMVFGNDGYLYSSLMAGSVFKLNLSATVPDTTAPSTPANLSAVASGSKIDLSWSISTDDIGVTGYSILRNNSNLASTTATSYSDATVSPGTQYTYVVKAYDAGGNMSTSSNSVTVTTNVQDITAPTAPANLMASVTGDKVNLTWTASTDNVGVTGYTVYSGSSPLGNTVTTGFTAPSLSPGVTYLFSVKASDAAGNYSGASNFVSASVSDVTPPSMLHILNYSATDQGPSSEIIAWTTDVPASGFVKYGLTTDAMTIFSYDVPETTSASITLSGLKKRTIYYYQVIVNNSAGSDQSPVSSFRTGR